MGRWVLVGNAEDTQDLDYVGDRPDVVGYTAWLNGGSDGLEVQLGSAAGLVLEIGDDGRFSESASGSVSLEGEWFDVNGILDEVVPFAGFLVENEQGVYLKADEAPEDAEAEEGRYGLAVLRYDDGDIKICEMLRRAGDRLVRSMNVIADEAQLFRTVLVYERQD